MVKTEVKPLPEVAPSALPDDELQWSSIQVQETVDREFCLKASTFGMDGRHARDLLHACKWDLRPTTGDSGFSDAAYPTRFKRIWVSWSEYPIYQPGQITELDPKPAQYLGAATSVNMDDLRVHAGQILMTRSGRSNSIGRTTYVSSTLDGRIFSDDLLRIDCREPDTAGYVYAFLNTATGRALIRSNEYGAMIPHIEPEHLERVPIPDPSPILKKRVHDLVLHSYALRDESNTLLKQAEQTLYDALSLPPLRTLQAKQPSQRAGIQTASVNASNLTQRLDAGHYAPFIDAIFRHLAKHAAELTTAGDSRVSQRIILPGRFARVYVGEGQGVPFFGGKQIHQLDPTGQKFLSLKIHGPRIREQLSLTENMILVTRSGTIGDVAIVPEHWGGLIASEHIIRIVPASQAIAGYLYVFLTSDYGRELIRRFSYGSTVPELDNHQTAQIAVPLLQDADTQQRINDAALKANKLRTQAYEVEQQAIEIVNRDVIHATA